MKTIMITRHEALVQYAIERGIVPADVEVLPHITEPAQVRGCHVVGPLPLHLAAAAAQVTHIPIRFGRDGSLRGVELSLEQVREMAGPPETYVVRERLAVADVMGTLRLVAQALRDIGIPWDADAMDKAAELLRGRPLEREDDEVPAVVSEIAR